VTAERARRKDERSNASNLWIVEKKERQHNKRRKLERLFSVLILPNTLL
jgi:hypothetical protein